MAQNTTANADFLEGGGELGERMRAFDWTRTPLGEPASWPRSLKTAVRIMLTSRQPFWLGWGPELTYLYNDAYKSIIGGKHPDALGKPFSEVWSEIWDIVGPMAEQVMSRDEGIYVEAQLLIMERHGYPEETYYTFSYSPVPDDEGGRGGLICANTDDTRRVIGERQIGTLREIAANAANARSWRDACTLALGAIATNPRDLPFAMVYLDEAGGGAPVLAAATPGTGHLDDPSLWPLGLVMRTTDQKLVQLETIASEIPCGAWDRPPSRAVVLPIAPSGGTGRAGALVVGLNPYRVYDAEYRGFIGLVAGQISAAIANAQAYEEERRRAEALAEIDRAKTIFFSNVSHEFRTPLTLMLGPIQDLLTREGDRLDPEALSTLTLANRNGQRLLKLVNTLLDFARIEAGRTQGSFEEVDLGAYTAELASNFRAICEHAGLELHVDANVGELAYVDPGMWEKVVLNLMSNAFKFTLHGGIRVGVAVAGDEHELRVTDSGTGIPEHELPRMFERFHRVEGAEGRSHEGSGIGLALVQELVKLHGGSIRVESRMGEGSTFIVRIPRGRAHLPSAAISPAKPQASVVRGGFVDEAVGWLAREGGGAAKIPEHKTHRVLLVDDNTDLREYARRLLSEQYDVVTAADGEQALEAARAAPPDIVITDAMMPHMDGFELIRRLREDPDLRTLPVIMLSARAGEEARIEGLDRGADDYLVKPFSSRELLVRVEAMLRAEKMRAEALRALSESEERFRALAEAAPAFIWRLDAHGDAQYVNRRFLDVMGRGPAELPAVRWYSLLHPEDREHFTRTFEKALAKRAPYQARGRLRRADGTWVWTDSHASPIFGATGEFLGYVGISLDVSANIAHEKSLEEADRRKDEFIATLSHELRNPLAPLRNAIFMLRMGGSPANATSLVDMMDRQVTHLVRLVDDLLEMSRISRGKLELRRERVELATVIRNAVETSSPLVNEHGHQLEVSLPPETLWIDGDPVRLSQIVSNMLNNAAKYAQHGGRIRIDASRDQGEIAIAVQDNGPGIEEELMPRIFEMFTRGDRASGQSQGGLGIGLALALSLAQMHGGTIEARNRDEGGAEFMLRLPLASRGSTAGAAPSTPTARLEATRVLVVDDNRDAGESLAAILTHLGARVWIALNGSEAIELFARHKPDVVLLDIGMPSMDGYEVARAIRARDDGALARLVALTGWGQDEDRRRSMAAGFDDHLVKPVEIQVLTQLLRSLETSGVA
jgi:PAS domain S-box-containing protein